MTVAFAAEPTTVYSSTDTLPHTVGDRGTYQGRDYVFVKNGAAAVHAKGAPAWPASATVLWTIGKVADVVGDILSPIGACPAIPAGGYGWMFIGGGILYTDELMLGTGSIAAQADIHAVADTFSVATIGTHPIFGQTIAADTPYLDGYFRFQC